MFLCISHYHHLVPSWDSFGDYDDRIQGCIHCFHRGLLCIWRGYKDHGTVCVCLILRHCDGVINWDVLNFGSTFSWCDASNNLCTVIKHEPSVKRALVSCNSLDYCTRFLPN